MTSVYTCDAFGNTLAGTTETYSYNAKYGYYFDAETGFYYCSHRYYDTQNGRWLTEDPIGFEGGLNLYGYCGNGPVGSVDASGKLPVFVISGIAGVVIGGIVGGVVACFNGEDVWIGIGKGMVLGGIAGLTGGLAGEAALAYEAVSVPVALISAGVSAAIGDAASQGVAIGLGWQDEYNIWQTAGAFLTGVAGECVGRMIPYLFKRNPLDKSVNRTAPGQKALNRPISKRSAQNADCQDMVKQLDQDTTIVEGSIRIDQQQINSSGNRVGINRPDLQYIRNNWGENAVVISNGMLHLLCVVYRIALDYCQMTHGRM